MDHTIFHLMNFIQDIPFVCDQGSKGLDRPKFTFLKVILTYVLACTSKKITSGKSRPYMVEVLLIYAYKDIRAPVPAACHAILAIFL